MADFVIRVLKWLAALVTAYFILFALLFLMLIGIGIAFQPTPVTVEPNSVLVLDLGFNLTDRPETDDPAALIADALEGSISQTASLRQVINTLESASNDSDIHGLLIKGNLQAGSYGTSFAALREFRQALLDFGKKKPVWSVLKWDTLRDYYLKSAATEVITDSHGMVDFRGLRAERLYLGEAFERIGIDVQVEAVGEFKTAGESFQQASMSEAEKEQLEDLIGDLWEAIVGDIAASRGVDVATLNAVAEKELFNTGKETIGNHLVDTIMTEDQLLDYLVSKVGFDGEGETYRQFDFQDYRNLRDPMAGLMDFDLSNNKVAILYIQGLILDGKSGDGIAGATTINRQLRKLRNDNSVKAVVLRVNSPGGSSTASSRIAREIELTNEEKPVVVSMGTIAASGGYMISAVGDYIFAESTTITGSIGVVSMLWNIEELAGKLSLHFEGVETHPFAGSFSLARAKTEEELRQIRVMGEQTYDEFLQVVAVNRGITRNDLLPLAQGRVWSGTAAVKSNLADEIGGLKSAVQRAADLAGIGDGFDVIERPRPLTLEEKIEEMLTGGSMTLARPTPRGQLGIMLSDLEEEVQRLASLNDPRGLYTVVPYNLKIY
ncbi:MAG: signal peptide peptidase SppA [Puniceicoccaceae bacterium]